MPDLDELAGLIGDQLAALVLPMFTRLEADFALRLEAASVRGAAIDDAGDLVLNLGDGSAQNLGRVRGLDGSPGADAPAAPVEALTARLCAVEGQAITGTVIGRAGDLVLLRADGSSLDVGQVVGRDGVDGQDGAPGPTGLGFEDVDVNLDADGRTLVISFVRGDLAQTFEIELPAMVYRGVFEAGREYRAGDAVSFGGSAWVCSHTPTSIRPGEGDGWTLAVKRGRDGKDFAGPALPKPKAVA